MPKFRNCYKLLNPEILAKNLVAFEYWIKGFYWNMANPQVPDPIFIVGCSRSGTSVTYETIRQSRNLLSFGYELPQLWNNLYGPRHNRWESEAASAANAIEEHRNAALKYFYTRLGIGRVLDKTCINIMRISYLIKLFPSANFIFIYRNGRDNINSLIEGWRFGEHFTLRKFLGNFPVPVMIDKGKFNQWCFFIPPGWRDYNEAPLEEVCAYQWIVANQMALDSKSLVPAKQWTELRYEDLFYQPIDVFKRIFKTLGLPFEEHIKERCSNLRKYQTSIVKGSPNLGKWKEQNPKMIERIEDKIYPMLKRLGYE